METRILLAIHGLASPPLDRLFWLSHHLGTFRFWAVVASLAILWSWKRGDRAAAGLWLGLGLSTWALIEGIKPLVARARPELWPRLIAETDFSFPSGHALASATLFPLLAWSVARVRPDRSRQAYALAIVLALFVSFGRLYLGVHWPTDVLAGWLVGAGQIAVARYLWTRQDESVTPGPKQRSQRGAV